MPTTNELKFSVERLEPRMLLSGNVIAALIGGDLFLTGDEQNNDIELSVVDGDLVVVGNETTINGSDQNFVVAESSNTLNGRVNARMRAGDDTIVFSDGVVIGEGVRISTGSGDDSVGVASQVDGTSRIRTEAGNDSVALNSATTRSTLIFTGTGSDTVSLIDSEVQGDLRLFLSSGNDNLVIENTTIERVTYVNSGSGADSIAVEDSQFSGRSKFVTRSGSDFLHVESSGFDSRSVVKLGSGDDMLSTDSNNASVTPLMFGSGGRDQINNILADGSSSRNFSFETDGIPDSSIEELLNDPSTGVLTAASQAQSVFGNSSNDEDNGEPADNDDPVDNDEPDENGDDTDNGDTGDGEVEAFSLDVDFTPSAVNEVNDVVVINDSLFEIEGTATPGATVALAVGDDGLFDDGIAIVGDDGTFEFSLRLDGEQQLTDVLVRARDNTGTEELIEATTVFFAVEQTVVLETSLGDIEIELLPEDAPVTVRNFLDYFEQNNELIVHRSPPDFVVQSGSFQLVNGQVESVETAPAIPNEFDPSNSNVRGTLSMALLSGQPDSGTSGWFINVVDNTNLDQAQHTVFGIVSDSGLAVADAINQLPIFDLRTLIGNGAFAQTPLRDYQPFSDELTGTLTLQQGSNTVTGAGTQFLTEIPPDNRILIDGQEFVIANVESDVSLTVLTPAAVDFTGSGNVNAIPDDDNYVIVRSQL